MSLIDIVPRKEQGQMTHIIQGAVIGLILTALSYAVGLGFNWINEVIILETFAVFGSYMATFLCVVERRANYPIGAVANAAYSLLFFQWGLYASSVVTGMLTFYLAYGWFRWGNDKDTRPVTRLNPWLIPGYLLITGVFYLLTVWAVGLAGGTLAATDSVILIGTMIAQLLLDNKKIENWPVWAVVNVFAIYTYFSAGLYLAAFQYIFFLANTVYGFYMWNKAREVIATQPAQAPVVDMFDDDLLGAKKASVW